jgi:DUF971 family protein
MSAPDRPKVITKSDPTRLVIEWADGVETTLTAPELRSLCQCANCVDEVTGQRTHDPASVPSDLLTDSVTLVGHYALAIRFTDGHDTGIYTFDHLRRAGDAAAD